MQDEKIIAFVGMMGSGKGSCTSYLQEKYGWYVIHFGNMLYEEVQRRGLDNVKDENFVRKDMREKEGPAVLAIHVARKAKENLQNGHKVIVLDGLYSWTEYMHLNEVFGKNLTVIAVVLPKKLRYQRSLDRKDSHRTYTLEQIVARDIAEIETVEKGGPIAFADYYLMNDGTREHLLEQLNAVIDELGLSN